MPHETARILERAWVCGQQLRIRPVENRSAPKGGGKKKFKKRT